MLRRVGEADRRAMVTLLAQAPQLNLYLLGNLESPGFDADYCEFWGDFDEAGRLRAVVNRYMNGWTLYGATDADWPRIGALMDDYPLSMERLQDNPGGVPSVLPYVQRYVAASVVEAEIMTLAAADFRPIPPPDGVEVRRATLVDLPQLITRYADAGSMRRAPAAARRALEASSPRSPSITASRIPPVSSARSAKRVWPSGSISATLPLAVATPVSRL